MFDDLILAGSQKGNIFVLNLTDATDVTSFSVNTPVEDLKLVGGELFVVAPQGQESIMVNFKPISDLNLSEKLKTAASDLQYSEPGAWEQHQFSEEIKNKIYYCMWLCKGCPKNIEDFGKKAFHDELPCTSEEKAKAVKLCAKLIQFQLEFPKAVVV